MSAPKTFHPALSAQMKDLIGKISNVLFETNKGQMHEDMPLIFDELMPEVYFFLVKLSLINNLSNKYQ